MDFSMKCANESVLGMPSIEIEFEFDMIFCFGMHLAAYAVFSTRIYP